MQQNETISKNLQALTPTKKKTNSKGVFVIAEAPLISFCSSESQD
jgi:hypothetical protein